jgi:hemolysin activation/secretion protein
MINCILKKYRQTIAFLLFASSIISAPCAFAQSDNSDVAAPNEQINSDSTENNLIDQDSRADDVNRSIEDLGYTEAEDDFIPTAEIVDINADNQAEANAESPYDDDTVTYEEGAIGDDQKLPNPSYEITAIHIVGNTQTSQSRIQKMMGLAIGDHVTLDELESARIRLAISGAFESVEIRLKPGHTSGTIDVTIDVAERSKLQINNYWLGSSVKSPFWMGVDATWIAPFSLPHRMNFAFAPTTTSDYSLNLSYLLPSVAQLPLSLMFSVYSSKSHEEIFG